MKMITTTQLRTRTTDLVSALQAGYQVYLIHRSKMVGTVVPTSQDTSRPANSEILTKALEAFEPKHATNYQTLMKRYNRYMHKRYGQGFS